MCMETKTKTKTQQQKYERKLEAIETMGDSVRVYFCWCRKEIK